MLCCQLPILHFSPSSRMLGLPRCTLGGAALVLLPPCLPLFVLLSPRLLQPLLYLQSLRLGLLSSLLGRLLQLLLLLLGQKRALFSHVDLRLALSLSLGLLRLQVALSNL